MNLDNGVGRVSFWVGALTFSLMGAVSWAADDLSADLEEIRQEFDMPGLGAVAFRWNAMLGIGVAGVRKVGDEALMTTADKFHVGSITKSMTATLAAVLVERDFLAWETKIGEVWKSSAIHVDYRDVDLRTLLVHRAGLSSITLGEPWNELMRPSGSPRQQRARLVRGALAVEPRFSPGSKVEYANLNFAVAGAMIEAVMDESWENLMSNRVWGPLKMKDAGLGPMASKGQVDQPWGHREDGTPVPPDAPGSDNPPALAPAGTVHGSLRDMARYGAFHLSRGKSVPRLLKEESFAILHGDANGRGDDWGMGWIRADRPWAGGWALNHGGSNTMNRAVIWLAPEKDFGFVVVTNRGGRLAAAALERAAHSLIARYAAGAEDSNLLDQL